MTTRLHEISYTYNCTSKQKYLMWFQEVNVWLQPSFKHCWVEEQNNWNTKVEMYVVLGHRKGSLADVNSNHYWTVGGWWKLPDTILAQPPSKYHPSIWTTKTIRFSSPWTHLRIRNGLTSSHFWHTYLSTLTTCPHQYPASGTQTPCSQWLLH